jgi:hypothetical protein
MSKAGRPSKGPRERVVTRLPKPLADVVVQAKDESPYEHMSDFLAAIVADHFGRPELKPKPDRSQQEELPLKTA